MKEAHCEPKVRRFPNFDGGPNFGGCLRSLSVFSTTTRWCTETEPCRWQLDGHHVVINYKPNNLRGRVGRLLGRPKRCYCILAGLAGLAVLAGFAGLLPRSAGVHSAGAGLATVNGIVSA